jgi:hypothetical protein
MNKLTLLALAFAVVSTSCNKDRWLNEDEAANEIEKSLAANQGGLARELSLKAAYLNTDFGILPCDETLTVTRDFSLVTDARTADFTYTWDITKECGVNATVIAWSSVFNGTYDFPRIRGTVEGSRSWVLTNTGQEHAVWLLNGSSSRNGSHTAKVRRQRSFDSAIQTTFTDIEVDKATREWIGGSAVANIILTGENGGTFTAVANVTINPDRTVTVLINGSTYTFELYG